MNKFSEFYPSALTNYITANGNSFNLLEYYSSQFTPLFTEWVDKFYEENADASYIAKVENFLKEFERTSVSDFYEVHKEDYANCKSIRDFFEYFAMNEMKNTSIIDCTL